MEPADTFDLARFLKAQAGAYDKALNEIRAGRKRSHWMWYVFPQYQGLGTSPTSRHYAIKSAAEAAAYLEHGELGPRLVEISRAALAIQGASARDVFGTPDDLKLRSCATLFAHVAPDEEVFRQILDRFFGGEMDLRTLELLKQQTD